MVGHGETGEGSNSLSPPSPRSSNAHSRRKAFFVVLALLLVGLEFGVPSIFWLKGAFNPATDGKVKRSSIAAPLVKPLPKLLVMSPTPKPMGEAIALGAVVHDLGEGGLAVVRGLADGTSLWMGTRLSVSDWWLSAADVSDAAIQPPPNFVGAMNVTIELRLPDTSVVDRQTLPFRWQAAAVAEVKPSDDWLAAHQKNVAAQKNPVAPVENPAVGQTHTELAKPTAEQKLVLTGDEQKLYKEFHDYVTPQQRPRPAR